MKTWIMIGMLVMSLRVQAQTPVRVNPAAVPQDQPFAFYLLSMANSVNSGPPLPYDPWPGEPLYSVGQGYYVIDDRNVAAAKAALQQMTMEEDEGPPVPGPTNTGGDSGGGGFSPLDRSYLTNGQLWIEITSIDTNDNLVYLRLHNTTNNSIYQIWSKTNLTDPDWTWGELIDGSYYPDGYIDFNPVPMTTPDMFFVGVSSTNDDYVGIYIYGTETGTTKPCATNDSAEALELYVYRTPNLGSALTLQWQLGGSAVYGQDYIITNVGPETRLTNSVTFPMGTSQYFPEVVPLYNTNLTFDTYVTLTLVLTNGYLIYTNEASVGVEIDACEPTNLFTVVTNLAYPIGIDYSPTAGALIASYNYPGGYPNNFIRIGTNNSGALTLTNWSGVNSAPDEVKVAIVKNTESGFVKGDMYFGNGTVIGKLSADGTVSNMTWCVLTNATETNTVGLRGSLYIDQSGTFSNDLIAVTGDSGPDFGVNMGVWQINVGTNGNPHPFLLASIPAEHFEGVITLTNDVAKWGPWAGKIITGDEDEDILYTIDTNGAVTSYDSKTLFPGGIGTEDFDLIPTNQDLYCVNYHDGENGLILKLSHTLFNNYVGDLLITQSGDGDASTTPKLFIVHWNGTNFITRSISLPSTFAGHFEHVTFAPINLPSHSQ